MNKKTQEEKITFLKEKELQKKALENYENIKYENLKNKNVQNPQNVQNNDNYLKEKFKAFQKTKKEIESKDLF